MHSQKPNERSIKIETSPKGGQLTQLEFNELLSYLDYKKGGGGSFDLIREKIESEVYNVIKNHPYPALTPISQEEFAKIIIRSELGKIFPSLYNELITTQKPSEKKLPSIQKIVQFWELFRFLLPAKTRQEAYEPAFNDLKAEFLNSLKFKSPSARRWLGFCFTVKTVLMVLDCFRVMVGAKIKNLFWNSILDACRKLAGG
jgi:hypothetical protein